jgi:hypothetical protein
MKRRSTGWRLPGRVGRCHCSTAAAESRGTAHRVPAEEALSRLRRLTEPMRTVLAT